MKKLFLLLSALVLISLTLNSQVTFYKIHLNGELNSQVFDMVALEDGTFATIGISDNQNGVSHVALTKLDCKGDIEWAKNLGPSSTINNVFSSLIQVENGDLVFINNVGAFQDYDLLIGRISLEGTLIWKNRYGGNRDDIGRAMVQTADGNFVITGSTNSYGTDTNGSLSYKDMYLMKVDQNTGEVLWSKTLGNTASIEGGYALAQDNEDDIYITGRFLVGGTFYTCILKIDTNGNILLFKGYGAPNHRTYGYGIAVTPEGDIAITGSTTIAKEDHTSLPDVYLIKTDGEGIPYFKNIYYPWIGSDNSESGSSLVVQENGGFGIGVPTQSFSNWSSGFVPNKNAIYSTDANGVLEKAILFNQGGSHYTHLSKSNDGGFLLSGFSNFFSTSFEFIPLLVKTNADYEGACNEIIVTSELAQANEIWDVQDISYVEGSGSNLFDYPFEAEFNYSDVNTQCETIPEIEAIISVSPNPVEPMATFDFTDLSMEMGTYYWDFGDGSTSTEQNPTHSYLEGGDFEVCFTLAARCDSSIVCTNVEVTNVPTGVETLSQMSLKVFPNPVENILTIEWGRGAAPQFLYIYDAQGRLLSRYEISQSARSYDISFSEIPQGIYFLQAFFKRGVVGKQIVKL